jgi:hypothetical protein
MYFEGVFKRLDQVERCGPGFALKKVVPTFEPGFIDPPTSTV